VYDGYILARSAEKYAVGLEKGNCAKCFAVADLEMSFLSVGGEGSSQDRLFGAIRGPLQKRILKKTKKILKYLI
jgi:hypothetical protein